MDGVKGDRGASAHKHNTVFRRGLVRVNRSLAHTLTQAIPFGVSLPAFRPYALDCVLHVYSLAYM